MKLIVPVVSMVTTCAIGGAAYYYWDQDRDRDRDRHRESIREGQAVELAIQGCDLLVGPNLPEGIDLDGALDRLEQAAELDRVWVSLRDDMEAYVRDPGASSNATNAATERISLGCSRAFRIQSEK